jgi:hypothetical protein
VAQTLNKYGLLADEDVQGATATGGGQPSQDQPLQSPLGQTAAPQLAGGALGVQRQDYGGAIANAGKQYAFNAKYAAQDQAYQRAIANAAFDRTNAYNTLNAGYTASTQEAERQNQLAQKALQERMSGRGLGNSGVFLGFSGDLTGDYNRYVKSLTDQYQGGIANAENSYGRTLGDIAARREGLWGAQGAEEEQARLERERYAAEQARLQRQADDEAAWRQDMLNQQRANAAQQPTGGIGDALAGLIGNSGLFSGVTGRTSMDQLLNAMQGIGDLDWLTSFYAIPGIPQTPAGVRARQAIVQANTPGSPYYIPEPVGHERYNPYTQRNERVDQPYGFDQGGIAL